ncbi:uncharacterized protein LOC100882592 isoform X1 [Megachile rotundata]|uniref:uncharacterized protein LOC100882592 isoform X1 n=1 Tax=Megachile rotundata TaxID=143995 RepID=UPI00061532D1|nr:PREDICTED: uncharacterized protein LOC100882592 isoform X1 [Megachile rotundata]
MEDTNTIKQQTSCYTKNKELLSRSYASKEEFVREFKKQNYEKVKAKELFLLVFSELEKAVSEGNINNLKKLSILIEYTSEIEDGETLKDYYSDASNPIKNTNLVILACKQNKQEVLKYLFDNDTKILNNLSMDIETNTLLPSNKDETCHNAFYYAVRSNNVELLDILINKWPSNYFSFHLDELDEILSRAYEELKLKNVLLSDEMEIFVENKLINLRFFSDTSKQCKSCRYDFNTIKERIELILENIDLLKTEYSNTETVDEKFLFVTKFIAQNIHVLKQQLKSTYDRIPWEEIEFYLVSFISSHTKREEINLFYYVILNKRKILNQLENFGKKLQEEKMKIGTMNISKISSLPKLRRDTVVEGIINKYPEFEELYNDYQQIRDIYSLEQIDNYIKLALSTDPAEREGQLIIIRALQVIGEYLKNTLESPKLSNTTSELFLLSLPKNTREIIIDLRNSLSHTYSLSKRIEIEVEADVNFFIGVQNDMKKVHDVVTNILYGNKIKMIRILLTKIVSSKNADEIKIVLTDFSNIEFNETIPESFKVKEYMKLQKFTEELSDAITDKTDYEKELFEKVNNTINFIRNKSKNIRADYVTGFKLLKCLSIAFNHNEMNDNIVRGLKFFASKILENFAPQVESHSLKEIAELTMKISHSVKTRIQNGNLEKVNRLVFEICYIAEFGINDIKWIERLREKLNEKCSFMPTNKQKWTCSLTEKEYNNHFALKLSELKNILSSNGLNDQLVEKCSFYKKNEKLQVVIKMLMLDIMSILGSLKNYLEDNLFLLDDNAPLLTGKCLRNHLAHDNALVSILLLDPSLSLILNARKLTTENIIKNRKKIGKLVRDDPSTFKEKYEQNLAIIINQKRMFVALEEGNLENLKDCLKKGADINARDINSWTTLHFAARGSSSEIIKFILDHNFNPNIKDINGQNPLHIAAAHDRKNIVQFFIQKTDLYIDDKDNNGKTPLHIAAENGNKDAVEILLQNNANTNTQDIAGLTPLHSAVKNNHIDVVKILLQKDVGVNEIMGGFTLLHIAAESGHLEIVNYLLSIGANINARNDRDAIPLHLAALNGHLEIVNTLVSNGADVNARVLDGCTPLHYAVENGFKEIVNVLLKHGANTNVSDNTYLNTPLHYATKDGHVGIVKILLKNNANTNVATVDGVTPLHFAVQSGHLEIVSVLLEYIVDVNATDKNKTTPLHYAAERGHKEIADLLIKSGAEINAKNSGMFTPLYIAAQNGHKDVINLLIENKAQINIRDIKGNTPLHAAATNDNKDIIDFLIKNKAEVNVRNNYGLTPLHTTAANGNKNIIELLIQNNAEVNARSNDGITPLHTAVVHGHKDAVIFLIKNGAEVNDIDNFGFTILHSAIIGGHKDVVNVLIQNKAKVNATGIAGNTPLHAAVETGNKEIVQMLVRNGADVNVKNKDEMTPLSSAVKKNYKKIVEVLVTNGANVNAKNGEALLIAIFAGFRDIVNILLENNARINIKCSENVTPLHLAVERGHTEIVNTLISKGANIHATAATGATPLHLAVQKANKEIVELLLLKGAKVNVNSINGTPLHLAVGEYGHVDIVRILLNNGANINIKDLKNRMPFELAVAHNQLESVKLLLARNKKIDINAKINDTWTVLHIATQEGNLEMIKYLIDKGSDINIRNASGSKPIHIAAREGFKDIVEFFLNKGLNIHDPGTANQTLLHYAAMTGQLEVVKYLISEGANINTQDANGLTPLHFAANFDYNYVVEVLLQNGAIYNTLDKFCRKPLDMASDSKVIIPLISTEKLFEAVKHNNASQVEKCIKSGAFVNAKYASKGYDGTSLHYAAWKGYDEIINILLQNKANPNMAGSKGFTPLHYAAKFSHLKIVMVLLSNGAVYNAASIGGKTPLDFAVDKNIINLLKLVNESFKNVKSNNFKVINDLNEIKDPTMIKAIMNARNRENQSLIVAALNNNFSQITQLEQVSQGDVSTQIDTALKHLRQEKYESAISIFRNVFEKRKEILGPDNPATLDIQIYIAKILYKQGSFQEAINILDEIIHKQKEIFELDNKYTLSIRSMYALIRYKQGKNEEAFNIYQEVYKKQEEILGPNHPDSLDSQFHIALVLDKQGKYEEALKINKAVFKKRKELFGANHHSTLYAQNNVAMVLSNQGKYKEALEILEEVFEKKKMVFGINHSDTIRTLFNIAGVFFTQKKYDKALKIYQEVFNFQKKTFGDLHTDTLNTQYTLGNVLFTQGKMIGAFKVYSECLDKIKSVFGPNHPTVLDIIKKIEAINFGLKLQGSETSEIIGYLQKNINIAASNGNIQIVRNLLKNGADVNDKDSEGRTPLHYAVSNEHLDVVNILLENGADVTQVTNKGNTPLHTAASKNNKEIIEVLLQHVSRNKLIDFINAKTTTSGVTALHVVAKNASVDIVKFLLSHGACYNIKNKEDKTPFDLSNNQDVNNLFILLEKLFIDAKNGNAEIIDNISALNSDEFSAVMNARDNSGCTLLQVAVSNNRKDIAAKLSKMLKFES